MITFLSKIFIKDRENFSSASVRSAYGTLCGIMGIIFNILLSAMKFIAGIISGSISMTADAFNNLSDAGSSVVTLLGFRMSERKPDKDHPFGHGRIEYISGLIVSMLIVLVGFELGKSSVEKILTPAAIEFNIIAIIILFASIAVKAYMAFYNFGTGKKIGSSAMRATAADSLSDCVATGVVLISTFVSHFFDINIDAYCGLAVAAFILFSGIRSAKETMDPLLGIPPSAEFIKNIENIVYAHGGVSGIHDLIVHDYGPCRTMISLHAEVDAKANILDIHDMIDNIEKELRETLLCDAVIHMDPIATDDEEVNHARAQIASFAKAIDGAITIHDFRMVKGPTHTNVIFDAVVPSDIRVSGEEVKKRLEDIVKTVNENYIAVINIDMSYV